MTDHEIDNLLVGQIITTPAGTKRTVLAISRKPDRANGRIKGRILVTVAILHCSWTHRPHTCLDRQTLRAGYGVTDVVVAFQRWKLAKMVLADLAACENGGKSVCQCCDVIGKFS